MSRAELYANDLAEVHAVAIDGVFAILDDEESPNITNWLGTLSATGTTVQTASITYLGSIKTAENTYKTASDAADAAFDTTTVTAYTNYHQMIHTLDIAFYAAVSDATDPTFTTTTYFNTAGANTNLPFQKTAFSSDESTDDTGVYRYGENGYFTTVGKTFEGMVLTGPQDMAMRAWNVLCHPIDSACNLSWEQERSSIVLPPP